VAPGIDCSFLEHEDNPNLLTRYTPYFMAYGAEAILPTDIEYGALRVRSLYANKGYDSSLKDTLDQLDEARNVMLLWSARY
jgi:lysyl-tRNA synthetase class I